MKPAGGHHRGVGGGGTLLMELKDTKLQSLVLLSVCKKQTPSG